MVKRTKIFKAFDNSQMDAFVQQWLETTNPTPKIIETEESTVMALVPFTTAKGTKNKRRPMLQLKVRYENSN
jgi:hypothetical protein